MAKSAPLHADLLVAGGAKDIHLDVLSAAARSAGKSVVEARHGPDSEPALTWDMASEYLRLNGRTIEVGAAFIRYDVFNPTPDDPMRLDRSLAWFSTLAGWIHTAEHVQSFNRCAGLEAQHKSAFIVAARRAGFTVPRTFLTNSRSAISGLPDTQVVKPAAGGAYCVPFAEADVDTVWNDDTAPAPVFAQELLVYPEFRVFVIGDEVLVFRIEAQALDHRADKSSRITQVALDELPNDLPARLQRFSVSLGLNFCAFDLKARPTDGALCLLEVNSGPMFGGFDAVAKGGLTCAMIAHLCSGGVRHPRQKRVVRGVE